MLNSKELLMIRGGGISTTLLNSLSRLIDTLLKLGQTVGSAIRRSASKKYCKLS